MNKSLLLLVVLLVLSALAFHTFSTRWCPPEPAAASGQVEVGVPWGFDDYLSYCAWIQQARHGMWRFASLYTTTEHSPLLINPFFLLIGRIAAWLRVDLIGVLNAAGIVCIPIIVFALAAICRGLGRSHAAVITTVCLALGGGGASWLRLLLRRIGLKPILLITGFGPDLYYGDLYPLQTFFGYPFHAAGFAAFALLLFLVFRYDNHERRLSWAGALALVLASTLRTSIRPYEPIVMATAYGGVLGASVLFRLPWPVSRRRLVILGLLLAGILPFTFYTMWASHFPVWSDFAGGGMNIPRGEWVVAFFLLWIAAGFGAAALGRNWLRSPYALCVLWTAGCFVLLVLLNSALTKLCGGCTIAMAMLGGVAVDRYRDRFRSRKIFVLTLVAVVLASSLSPAWVIWRNSWDRAKFRIPAEVIRLAAEIREDTETDFPTVLTDDKTGVWLPGFFGFRVFTGHWTFTDGGDWKTRAVKKLGFRRADATLSAREFESPKLRAAAATLLEQVRAGKFEYLVVRKDHVMHDLVFDRGWEVIHDGDEYIAGRMTVPLCDVIESKIEELVAEPDRQDD